VAATPGNLNGLGPLDSSNLPVKRFEKVARRADAVLGNTANEDPRDIAVRDQGVENLVGEILGQSSSSSTAMTPTTPPNLPLVKKEQDATPTPTSTAASGPLAGLEDLLRAREDPEERPFSDYFEFPDPPPTPTPSSSDPLGALGGLLGARGDAEATPTPTSTPSSSGPLAGLEDLLRAREDPEEQPFSDYFEFPDPTPTPTPSSSDPLEAFLGMLGVRGDPEATPTPTSTPPSSGPLAGLDDLLRAREILEENGYQLPSTFERRLAPTKTA
jgi:hypothetical protein